MQMDMAKVSGVVMPGGKRLNIKNIAAGPGGLFVRTPEKLKEVLLIPSTSISYIVLEYSDEADAEGMFSGNPQGSAD